MRPRTDDEILEDLKDWPVRNIYVERGVRLIEQLRQRVRELEKHLEARHYYNGNRGFKDLQTIEALTAERDNWQEAFRLYVADYERVCAERDALEQQMDALVKAATMAVEMIEYDKHERRHVRWKLNDAIASVKEK